MYADVGEKEKERRRTREREKIKRHRERVSLSKNECASKILAKRWSYMTLDDL